jgi:hypothetical protein
MYFLIILPPFLQYLNLYATWNAFFVVLYRMLVFVYCRYKYTVANVMDNTYNKLISQILSTKPTDGT